MYILASLLFIYGEICGALSLICIVNLSQTALVGFYDVPEAIEPAIMYVNGRYKDTPVYITENGELQLLLAGT